MDTSSGLDLGLTQVDDGNWFSANQIVLMLFHFRYRYCQLNRPGQHNTTYKALQKKEHQL